MSSEQNTHQGVNTNNVELWGNWHTSGLLLIVGVMVVLGLQTKELEITDGSAPWTWYLNMLALLAFVVIAGSGTTGRRLGFLIDSRNKMTLSRLQLIVWTIVILSSYMVVVLARVADSDLGYQLAFSVVLPKELWMLMGISLVSLVGSPLVLSDKKTKDPDPTERNATVASLAAMGARPVPAAPEELEATSRGVVLVNKTPEDARVADMFRGDETGNAAHLDMSKVQMFLFTLILVIVYLIGLQGAFADLVTADKAVFPVLDASMITLLGISHAGYLSYKAIPHSRPPVAS